MFRRCGLWGLSSLLILGLGGTSGCGEPEPPPPPPQCTDGLDNDGDAFIDDADPGCLDGDLDSELDDQCADGLDNDFDGLVDIADPECAQNPNAEANLQALPDLVLDPNRNNVFPGGEPSIRTVQGVDETDPEFLEGCFTGTGTRTILEWNSIIQNIGDANLVVGSTENHQPPYTFNENLGQLQFEGWTRSFLLDANNNIVAQGHKGSFCMFDIVRVEGFDTIPQFSDGNCANNQGISVGFADVYSIGLDCQFIDITDVPTGENYTLLVEVNFTRELPEKNYDNNTQEYEVFIP